MDFYDIEAELYDLFYFDFKEDISLYKKYADRCENVLELFCGTGRILCYLNNANMYGIDLNENMLSLARKNLEGKNVKLLKGDARKFKIEERFCLEIIGINSLLMFPKEDRMKILKNAYQHLLKGGRLIVDIINPFEMVEGIVHHGDTKFRDNKIYTRFFVPIRKDEYWKILYFYDIVENENLRRKVAEMTIYPVEKNEIVDEMKDAGFKIENVFGDYDMNEFSEYSERIIVVGLRYE